MVDMQSINMQSINQRYTSRRLLGIFALIIAGIAVAKFLGLMVTLGPARSPWFVVLAFVVPFLVGWRLLKSQPRVGAGVIGVFSALLAAVCVGAVATGIEPYWGDYLLVLVGGPLALAAVGLAIRVGINGSEQSTNS